MNLNDKKNILALVKIFFILSVLAGCSYAPIKGFVSEGKPLSPIKSVVVRVEPGLYNDVTEAFEQELRRRSIEVKGVEFASVDSKMRSDQVDTIIWINATKSWDILSYIKRIEIRIFNAKTGILLGTGRWETRWWHGFRGSKEVVNDLLDTVLARTQNSNQ